MVRFGLLIAALVILLDQISKAYVFHVLLDPPRIVPVTDFFNFVVVWNRGVSFGIRDSASRWTPVLLSAVAIGIAILRSEERRVENECVSTYRSRWSTYH